MGSTFLATTSDWISKLLTWVTWKTFLTLLSAFCFVRVVYDEINKRTQRLPMIGERVLILGASSGVGRAMAKQYAARGARVCVVGRREALLAEVREECLQARRDVPGTADHDIAALPGDFTSVADMINIRTFLEEAWGGLDTLVVAAGVSALKPLLAVTGVQGNEDSTKEGIQRTVDIAAAATRGNYVGPLIAAVTLIPTLSRTSKAPAILLLNSVAAIIPAPTRTLYASTKAASLLLYQALSIEHPNIAFTHFLPATIEGDFRASAVDSGPVRELDPNKHGLKREKVAKRAIEAVDMGEKNVIMPFIPYHFAHFLYWMMGPSGSVVESMARKKYNYNV
ncbi:11-beta-hydroxysteroid dehydrogenase-like 4A [Psilocybe cubensis]|uniref:NAD(P)-binding protein n=2 Tax=Psilocybe cubensis TaxID=181762 RepID=A0A8H7Y9D1_PSICU|nr:11-beta-hydroxysteroid dehydrogenase-like 4A [Psilocybe cubensis]KAH9487391.1 11-beta-hydroxysteroid dehydrogenase-like 4A [Psilocybe cubensis]